MKNKNDPGYRIMGIKDGWMVTTEKGIFFCPFIAMKKGASPAEALLEALEFIRGK